MICKKIQIIMQVETNNEKEKTESVQDGMQKLEEALLICKFGYFHVKLLFTTFCAVLASVMVTTTSSYILPSAECDLEMDIMQKGLLNAMPFFGQVGAALFTGFITDAFGRKIFLIGGHLGIFVCAILEGLSQTYWMLVLGKAVEGVFLSLCFGATAAMVTEFTHKDVRNRVMLLYSSFMSLSLIVAALMSWAVLPQPWDFVIVKDYFVLHSWNIYLLINSIWSLLAALLYYSLPESPKFLLSHDQENEALEVLKEMYSVNTGNDRNTFPIASLSAGTITPSKKSSFKTQLAEGLFEVKNLFRKPLFLRLLLFSFISFVCLLAYSALRLWYPQISTIIETYQKENGQTARFCVMIDDYRHKLPQNSNINNTGNAEIEICVPKLSGSETYINGVILGLISLSGIGISAFFVDYLGQKPLMFMLLIFCGTCSGVLYWTNSSIQIGILVSATCGFMQTAMSLQHSLLVRVFPTTLRTIALSLILMFGRIGSLLGSITFPVMLASGCMTPFITLSVITLSVAGLVFLLPSPSRENNGSGDR